MMVSQASNGGGCCGSAHAHPQPNGKAAPNASHAKGRGVKYVLLDIEGTTTSISFVHDVLFPFARNATERHIRYIATLHSIHPGTAERSCVHLQPIQAQVHMIRGGEAARDYGKRKRSSLTPIVCTCATCRERRGEPELEEDIEALRQQAKTDAAVSPLALALSSANGLPL